MDYNYPLPVRTVTGEQPIFGVESNKTRSDLVVLRHMLHQVRLQLAFAEDNADAQDIVQTVVGTDSARPGPSVSVPGCDISVPTSACSDNQPLLYHLQERRQRAHRVVLYQPHALSMATNLPFVSFISRRRVQIDAKVLHDIAVVDQQMLVELTRNSSLLSYSSLELHSGNWYNLVLFNDERGKEHFKSSKTHNYAAYELSPNYYAWIRLHHGRIVGGVAQEQLILQKTRYYFFGKQSQPHIYETHYV